MERIVQCLLSNADSSSYPWYKHFSIRMDTPSRVCIEKQASNGCQGLYWLIVWLVVDVECFGCIIMSGAEWEGVMYFLRELFLGWIDIGKCWANMLYRGGLLIWQNGKKRMLRAECDNVLYFLRETFLWVKGILEKLSEYVVFKWTVVMTKW